MKTKLINSLPLIFLILAIQLSIWGCGNSEQKEIESNDSWQTASAISSNSVVKGNLRGPGDVDIYVINSVNEKWVQSILSISLSKVKGLDLQFEVYHGNKLLKVVDDYQKNEGERLDNLLMETGRYFIVVKAGQYNKLFSHGKLKLGKNMYPSEVYKLTVSSKKADYRETESNDHPGDSTPLEMGKAIRGYFSPFHDKAKNNKRINEKMLHERVVRLEMYDNDWYQFEIGKAGQHFVSIVLSAVPEVDSVMAVYQDKPLIYMNSKGRGQEERIANLAVEGKKKYYIQVIGVPRTYHTTSETGYSYTLTVNQLAQKEIQTEAEANNSLEQSNLITNKEIHGLLSPKDDVDYYRVAVNAELVSVDKSKPSPEKLIVDDSESKAKVKGKSRPVKVLNARLKGVPDLDLELHLLDEKGNLLRVVDDSGIGKDEIISHYDVTDYDYVYLMLRGGRKNQKDNYKEMYQLTVTLDKANKKFELEPNDGKRVVNGDKGLTNNKPAKEMINKLVPNRAIYGYISPNAYRHMNVRKDGDVDIYEIEMKSKKRYKLELTGINGVELKLMIYEDSNNLTIPLAGFTEITLKKKASIVRYIRPTLKADSDKHVYRIKVWSKFGRTSNASSPYRLRIREY